jgi:thiamine-phosphate pyrophosphorylase
MIDANLNRLREGIRVVEDVCRFVVRDEALARSLKTLRSQARSGRYDELLAERDAENDLLRPTTSSENERDGLRGVVIANFKRAQEAARVLEEAMKISEPNEAETYKTIRYALYAIEKETIAKLPK